MSRPVSMPDVRHVRAMYGAFVHGDRVTVTTRLFGGSSVFTLAPLPPLPSARSCTEDGFETFATSHAAAQDLYSMQGFSSARSDLRSPPGADSDNLPTMRRHDDDSQS